jgi:hypothetical protein
MPSLRSDPLYQVHVSGAIARRIEQVQRQASLEGRGQAALKAFKEILNHLEREPTVFGEPLYRLPGLRMRVRHAAIRPLFVGFAVCEDWPLVFIKGIRLLAL